MLSIVLAATTLWAPAHWLDAHWRSAAACVDMERVVRVSSALLGDGPPPPRTRLDLWAEPHEDGWRVRARIQAPQVELTRVFADADCGAVSDALAIVLAVQVGASTSATQGVPKLEHEPLTAPPPSRPGEREPADAPPPTPAPVDRPSVVLGAGLGVDVGVLPGAGGTAEVWVGAAWPHLRLEAAASSGLGFEGWSVRPGHPAVRGVLLAGTARGCGVLHRRKLELPLCGGVEAGRLQVQGVGLDRPRTANAPWLAAVIGARPRWRMRPRIALGFALEAVVPVLSHRFVSADAGTLHTPSTVAGRAALTVEFRLPPGAHR